MERSTPQDQIAALERWRDEKLTERERATEERQKEIDTFVEYLRAWMGRLAAGKN